MQRLNFYSSASGDDDSVRLGLNQLDEVCGKLDCNKCLIVTPSQGNLAGLDRVLKPAQVKLLKSGKLRLPSGVEIEVRSVSTVRRPEAKVPTLVLCPTPAQMIEIECWWNVPALIVLPQSRADIQPWLDVRGAVDLHGKKDAEPLSVHNPVVKEALETLNILINPSSFGALDKADAIAIFSLLQEAGEVYTRREVRAQLVRLGRQPDMVETVADISETPSRKRSAVKGERLKPDQLEIWRRRASEKSATED